MMDGGVLATHDNLRLRIVPDDCPPDPRLDWDHLCTMVCFHDRYSLGDQHNYHPLTALDDVLEENEPDGVWAMPLYLMDHSGLAIRTDPGLFQACDSAGWDWGKVGFIYVPKALMRKEFPSIRADLELAHKAEEIMWAEVEEYDQYLQGDVWLYIIERQCTDPECGHWVTLDCCGGYFGYDVACEEARKMFDWHIEHEGENASG